MMCRSSSRTARSTSAPLGSASSSAWAPSASTEGVPRWHRPGSSGTRTLSSASTLVLSMIPPGSWRRRPTNHATPTRRCSCLLEAAPLAGFAPAGRDVVLRPVPHAFLRADNSVRPSAKTPPLDTPSCVIATILVNLAAVNRVIAARGRQCRRRDGAVPTAVRRALVAPCWPVTA